jgi:hypothetical protein
MKPGIARAKAKGIRVGPRLDIELRQKIAQRAANGETAYAIAKVHRPAHGGEVRPIRLEWARPA